MADVPTPKKMPAHKVKSMLLVGVVAGLAALLQFYLLYQAGEK